MTMMFRVRRAMFPSLLSHKAKPNAEAAGTAYFPACVVVASASSLYPVALKGLLRGSIINETYEICLRHVFAIN